jgi:hypothetical protein
MAKVFLACLLFLNQIAIGSLVEAVSAPEGLHGLRNQLSQGAKVYLPGDEGFKIATDRWNVWENPEFDVVIEPAVEEDVGVAVSCSA